MNTAFEPVLAALLAHFQATCTLPFAADATANSATLSGVTNFTGLFEGVPVFGPGLVRGSTIVALDQQASEITLSDPVSTAGVAIDVVAGFQTLSRRIPHWSKVAAQPFLGLRRIGTSDDYDSDSYFGKTTLKAEAWIYCTAGQNPDLAPDTGLNVLEQLVRNSFAPDCDYGDPRFTLGGLVFWCRFEGEGQSSPGDQGDQALSLMPIRITLP